MDNLPAFLVPLIGPVLRALAVFLYKLTCKRSGEDCKEGVQRIRYAFSLKMDLLRRRDTGESSRTVKITAIRRRRRGKALR